MTVEELIRELREAPQDAPVFFSNDDRATEGAKPVDTVLWDMERGRIAAVVLTKGGGDAGMSELKPCPSCGAKVVEK